MKKKTTYYKHYTMVTGLFILSMNEGADFIDLIFEVFSAFGTVGLSASLTPTLTVLGKLSLLY